MKKGAIDLERTVVANYQAPEVAEPADRAFDHPASSVPAQRSAILRGRTNAILLVRTDQFDPATPQTSTQRIAVVRSVGNHPFRLLARTPRVMPPAYADRRQRRLREPDLRRGCRTKVLSQRNTLAVDHHHPLRPLAPLGFSDSAAPFFAEAKLPSKNDSLQSSCSRSFNSLKNVRQMFNQTPCSSQSRSRRQQVEGCGYFSGRSCQRAPLRRIQRIPSNTRRFSIHGRPPLRCSGGLGSKGAIFCHCPSVSNGRDRAIGPPSALLTLLIPHFPELNHPCFKVLSAVMQQLLVNFVLAILAFTGGYALLRPHVSLEPFLQPNPKQPLNALFSVTNDNSIFEVHDLMSVCVIWHYTTSKNNIIGNSLIAPTRDKIFILEPKTSSTVRCPSPFVAGDAIAAEIEIDISYRQDWWPRSQIERYPFAGIKDSQGTIHWTHRSLAEQR